MDLQNFVSLSVSYSQGISTIRKSCLSDEIKLFPIVCLRSYGSWIARNPSLVLFMSVAIVLALSSGLYNFKVETRPEKVCISFARTIVIHTLYDMDSAEKSLQILV